MYVLDTDILSHLARRQPEPGLVARLRKARPDQLHTTVVTVMEMQTGAMLRHDAAEFWRKLSERILSKVRVLDLTPESAVKAGDIMADLQKRGEGVGLADTLIAGIAISSGMTLVTGNTKHFQRIHGLKFENWML